MQLTHRDLFLKKMAQTSGSPMMLEIISAKGCELTDVHGKKYIDLISGISVSSLGHGDTKVVDAVKSQIDKYMHLMVYGEYVEHPQTKLADKLSGLLPDVSPKCYFVNSGSEAIEGAMKLSKRYTGRYETCSFRNAYHGSTHGALSIMGNEEFKRSFRPLVPGNTVLGYNDFSMLSKITRQTACVVMEAVQAEAGCIMPDTGFLEAVRERCDETGALLVLDEIQTGMKRTGPMMAFQQSGIVPDILVLAKSLGGGMPLGCFIARAEIMDSLTNNPPLGHITTFGGHPVSCAAALAAFEQVEQIGTDTILAKESLIRERLIHPAVKEIRGRGLLLAVDLGDPEFAQRVISKCIEKGIIVDWFLFSPHSIRIAPPLIINNHEIFMSADIILESIESSL